MQKFMEDILVILDSLQEFGSPRYSRALDEILAISGLSRERFHRAVYEFNHRRRMPLKDYVPDYRIVRLKKYELQCESVEYRLVTPISLWTQSFCGISRYEEDFEDVLPIPLRELMPNIEMFPMMDFMGYGQVLTELEARRGLALALEDNRTLDLFLRQKGKVELVVGDAYCPKIWSEVDSWLASQANDAAFKLILGRPSGAIYDLNNLKDRSLPYLSALDRLYQRLSFEGGIMVVQCPGFFHQEIRYLAERINEQYSPEKIEFNYDFPDLPVDHFDPGLRLRYQSLPNDSKIVSGEDIPLFLEMRRTYGPKHYIPGTIFIKKNQGAPLTLSFSDPTRNQEFFLSSFF